MKFLSPIQATSLTLTGTLSTTNNTLDDGTGILTTAKHIQINGGSVVGSRSYLVINDNSAASGASTTPSSTLRFSSLGVSYWDNYSQVGVNGSSTPASDFIGWYYNGTGAGSKFSIYGNGKVSTLNNVLDDGTGAATFNKTADIRVGLNSTTTVAAGSTIGGIDFRNNGTWSGGIYATGGGDLRLFSGGDGANPRLIVGTGGGVTLGLSVTSVPAYQLLVGKNNAAIVNTSYNAGNIQVATNDGSNPIIGFHRSGYSAIALYHAGFPDALKIRRSDGLYAAATDPVVMTSMRLTLAQINDATNLSSGTHTNSGDGIPNPDGTVFKGGWWHIYNSRHYDGNGFAGQIAIPLSTPAGEGGMYYRWANGTTWGAWIPAGGLGSTIASLSYYVNPTTGSDANSGLGTGTAFKTLAYALSILPKNIKHIVTITLADGTYNEVIAINGFNISEVNGLGLRILGNTTTPANVVFTGRIDGTNIVGRCQLSGITSSITSSNQTFQFVSCTNIYLDTCTATANAVSLSNAAMRADNSQVYLYNCTLSNHTWGVMGYASKIMLDTVGGSGNQTGVYANFGTQIFRNSSALTGSTPTQTDNGAQIIGY
jgi:hypothetical protein